MTDLGDFWEVAVSANAFDGSDFVTFGMNSAFAFIATGLRESSVWKTCLPSAIRAWLKKGYVMNLASEFITTTLCDSIFWKAFVSIFVLGTIPTSRLCAMT